MASSKTLSNTRNPIFSLVTLLFASQLATALSRGTIFKPAKAHIYVTNNLGTGENLTVHCKSKNDDVGVQVLKPGGFFTFSFRPNYLGGTLFFCGMSWPGNSRWFDIYDESRDIKKCNDCCWFVKRAGPCRCPCNSKAPCGDENCLPWR